MKYDNLLRYAVRIVLAYPGNPPLQYWLKSYYKDNPQMGSRDRRTVSEMVYAYYRLGQNLNDEPTEDKIITALFLCNDAPLEPLEYLRPEWNKATTLPLEEKIQLVAEKHPSFSVDSIFPWTAELSAGVDARQFALSFLQKPNLFARVRPGKEETVTRVLGEAGLPHASLSGEKLRFPCLSFPSGTKLDKWLTPDKDIVIQDLSSQKTAMLFDGLSVKAGFRAWDCCAASGGKSIQLSDLFAGIDITVSDIRESILDNLEKRFRVAEIVKYKSLPADLTKDRPKLAPFDLIIADLPCTGSGTWSRTPDALFFFKAGIIDEYARLQAQMLKGLTNYLKPGGRLVSITCSVFAKENEAIVSRFAEESGWKTDKITLFRGYDRRADSMFGAVLIKEK